MDYFVSIENIAYYHWQAALLLESFKHHKIQNQLLISIAAADNGYRKHLAKNLFSHPRIYFHENIGRIRGYGKLNNLYSLLWALENEKLKQPVCYLESDFILYSPLDYKFHDATQVVVSKNPYFTLEIIEKEVGPFWEVLGKTRKDFEDNFPNIGPLILFNHLPHFVLERVINFCEVLAVDQIKRGRQEIWKDTDKLAWAVVLNEYIGQMIIQEDNLVNTMLDYDFVPFIHYEHGLPPTFNKNMFKFNNDFSFGNPFEVLSRLSTTPVSYFISNLAKKLEKQND